MAGLNQLTFGTAPRFFLAAASLQLLAPHNAHAGDQAARERSYIRDLWSPASKEAFATASSAGIVLDSTRATSVIQDLSRQLDYIASLQKGWDGYNGQPISPLLIAQMRADLSGVVSQAGIPVPDLVPGGDGSLQAEWHEVDAQLTYRLDAKGTAHTWIEDRRSGTESEAEGVAAHILLGKWLPKLKSLA